jgi:hypothetical protein
MRAFVLWSHAVLILAGIPLTGLLAFWALLAESGGKSSHPEVLPPMLWGLAELTWTVVMSVRCRHLPLPSVRWRLVLFAVGLALTLVVVPVILIATTLADGPERALIAPYVLLAVGCRLARVGIAPVAP